MKHCRDCPQFKAAKRANDGYEAGRCERLDRRVAGCWPICAHFPQAPGYAQWMQAVDQAVWALAGVSVYDLPDCLYRDWYEARVKPKTAAKRAIKQAF